MLIQTRTCKLHCLDFSAKCCTGKCNMTWISLVQDKKFKQLYYFVSRFPNVVVSILTRDSVRQALKSGITASQIVGYVLY